MPRCGGASLSPGRQAGEHAHARIGIDRHRASINQSHSQPPSQCTRRRLSRRPRGQPSMFFHNRPALHRLPPARNTSRPTPTAPPAPALPRSLQPHPPNHHRHVHLQPSPSPSISIHLHPPASPPWPFAFTAALDAMLAHVMACFALAPFRAPDTGPLLSSPLLDDGDDGALDSASPPCPPPALAEPASVTRIRRRSCPCPPICV
jgi:hypothetical protein